VHSGRRATLHFLFLSALLTGIPVGSRAAAPDTAALVAPSPAAAVAASKLIDMTPPAVPVAAAATAPLAAPAPADAVGAATATPATPAAAPTVDIGTAPAGAAMGAAAGRIILAPLAAVPVSAAPLTAAATTAAPNKPIPGLPSPLAPVPAAGALPGAPPATLASPLAQTPADTLAPAAAPAADTAAIASGSIAGAADATASVAEEGDLWSRIRHGFKMPDLDNKKAQSSTRWYAAQPEYIERMSTRASMYLFHIVEEIEKRGMPTELALLPFVESAMQPEAVSFAKAAGLWQFIPSTGRLYSLEQNLWKDERFGVIESTRAALDYLQKLYAEFGDWQLALAAYNCGEAGVERALARARAQHRSVAYEDLRLPAETQYYVPKLQAIKNIVADPQHYGIALPAIPNQPYFVAFNKTLDMDVATAARLADMPVDEFRLLNPAFNRPVIVGASSPTILVPADRAESFDANLAAWQATGQPLASWTAYTLQPGEVLGKVAERVGLTEGQLREANRIPPRYRPVAGSTILVPRDGNVADDIAPGFMTASFTLVPEYSGQRQVSYRVRRGDTLATVARRWHVSAEDIVAWNQLHSQALFTGQRLNLTVGHAAAAPSPRKVAHKATPAATHAATHVATHASAHAATGTAKPTAATRAAAAAATTAAP